MTNIYTKIPYFYIKIIVWNFISLDSRKTKH